MKNRLTLKDLIELLRNEKKENNYNENNWSNEPDTSNLNDFENLEFY